MRTLRLSGYENHTEKTEEPTKTLHNRIRKAQFDYEAKINLGKEIEKFITAHTVSEDALERTDKAALQLYRNNKRTPIFPKESDEDLPSYKSLTDLSQVDDIFDKL